MMVIDNQFNIGQFVYLITDVDQVRRIITAISIRGNNSISYEVSLGTSCGFHYDFELSLEPDIITKTTN
jgi:hypothetical protein